MIKVLHATGKFTPSKGQLMQLEGEAEAARELGIAWVTRCFCPGGVQLDSPILEFSETISVHDCKTIAQKIKLWAKFRREFYRWLLVQEEDYDVILIRYNFHDPYQLHYLKKSTKPVYLIHHTKEIPELRSGHTAVGYARSLLDHFIGAACLRSAFGVVGVTEEIANYEKERSGNKDLKLVTYSNGISTATVPLVDKVQENEINLLFVAGIFAPWHGIDLLLGLMEKDNRKFRLHLVGELGAEEKNSAIQDERIIVHGVVDRKRLPEIAKNCDIGIGSLAMYRVGLEQTSSLKTREYLSLGLPVFSTCEDVFPVSFPFYLKDSLTISSILDFALETRTFGRQEVRNASVEYIDKKYILKRLYGQLSRQVDDI